MAQTKQKLVIKPKSVHVAQAFDIAFPVSEQSVFSDSYGKRSANACPVCRMRKAGILMRQLWKCWQRMRCC